MDTYAYDGKDRLHPDFDDEIERLKYIAGRIVLAMYPTGSIGHKKQFKNGIW